MDQPTNTKLSLNSLIKPLILIAFVLVLLFCLIISGAIFLNRANQPEEQEEQIVINSRTIVDKISEEAFIVTKTVVLDQKSKIEVDQGSTWSNFLWGQSIEAEALIRLDIGVDFNKIEESDIAVNNDTKTITVKLPNSEILDASQYGDIEVSTSSGVLKFLLDNDPNRDHNEALRTLISEAKEAIVSDNELFDEAETNALKILQLLMADSGYKVVEE